MDLSELKEKKVLVVGAGKSGLAVSRFLAAKGAAIVLADAGRPNYPGGELEKLAAMGVEVFLGGYPEVNKKSFDLVVISPGVPLTVDPAQKAVNNGIPLTGELELAYCYTRAPIVAITGTNGKTTTTTLIGEVFKDAGYKTLVGGNIGVPLVTEVENYGQNDVIVAEVSSFQLETTTCFKPKVAVILNITPDHLDRHGNMENYTLAKAKIFANQDPNDFTILNYDDPLTRDLAAQSHGKVVFFSRRHELNEGVFVSGEHIVSLLNGKFEIICEKLQIGIPGSHNLENALAAVAASRVAGIEPFSLSATLTSFQGVSHRLEFVAEIKGVRYINDSKGTNPDASIKALEAYEQPIVLIAGGKNKGSDFSQLAEKVKEKAKALVVLGQSAGLIAEAAKSKGFDNILYAGDFQEAVLLAHRVARPGDIVLLSPACASWDMFNSFEERGELFKDIVRSIS